MKLLASIGKAFVPQKIRPHLRSYLLKAGVSSSPYTFFGVLFFIALGLAGIFYAIISPYIQPENPLLQFILVFVVFTGLAFFFVAMVIGIMYFYLDTQVFIRTRRIEEILPEYLQLVSTNVKSGLSFEYALWYAIKPKFGVLSLEMHFVLKKVMTGYELADALEDFASKYDSPIIRRSFHLLIGEIESGGKIGYIIDSVVKNLKNNQKMKAEMAASAVTYIIFIGAIVIIISPVLFALSYNLLSFITAFVTKIAASGAASSGGPFQISAGSLDLGEFRIFSFSAVIVVSLLSSMIVSIIEKGTIRAGLKYIPIFTISSVISYILFTIILTALFSGIQV